MAKLSLYILTKNSEKYLDTILRKVSPIIDEVLIIDSGSSDNTEKITKSFNAKFIFHKFTDFKSQREFAVKECEYKNVMFLDDDEIPDEKLIESIKIEKELGFNFDAYRFKRDWNVLSKDIKVIYPIISPDYPIRIYNKNNS